MHRGLRPLRPRHTGARGRVSGLGVRWIAAGRVKPPKHVSRKIKSTLRVAALSRSRRGELIVALITGFASRHAGEITLWPAVSAGTLRGVVRFWSAAYSRTSHLRSRGRNTDVAVHVYRSRMSQFVGYQE